MLEIRLSHLYKGYWCTLLCCSGSLLYNSRPNTPLVCKKGQWVKQDATGPSGPISCRPVAALWSWSSWRASPTLPRCSSPAPPCRRPLGSPHASGPAITAPTTQRAWRALQVHHKGGPVRDASSKEGVEGAYLGPRLPAGRAPTGGVRIWRRSNSISTLKPS